MSEDAEADAKINDFQKIIEKILLNGDLPVSIYEFRETVERYVGLTRAEFDGGQSVAEHEREIFRIAPAKNVERASICLNRRNRKRLLFHQTEARRDFLNLIERIFKNTSSRIELEHSAIELVKLTKDSAAQNEIEKIFAVSLQIGGRYSVKKPEKDLWKPEAPKPSPAKQIPPLQTLNATAGLHGKD